MCALRVINILYHPPAYPNSDSGRRPRFCENAPGSGVVGTDGTEWPDLLGRAVVQQRSDIIYDVWQPDSRASRPVSWQLADRLTHTLFPAKEVLRLYGFKPVRYTWSAELARQFAKLPADAIVHMNSPFEKLSQRLLRRQAQRPYLLEFHSANLDVVREKIRLHRNAATSLLYWRWETSIRRLPRKVMVYKNSPNTRFLRSCDAVRCERIFMGCDITAFPPGPKEVACASLGLSSDTCVLSMASRFNPGKQIDTVISVLAKMPAESRFCLLLAGHGDRNYTNHLQSMATRLLPASKVRFMGFLNESDLRSMLQASDLFISAAKSEGGPVSVMKALACETPVMCTRVGGVDDILAEHGAGLLVDPFDYDMWERHLRAVLQGTRVPILPRDIVRRHFDWPNIAEKFIQLYQQLAGQTP